jgi:c(7)-type cytochrome triheme protein
MKLRYIYILYISAIAVLLGTAFFPKAAADDPIDNSKLIKFSHEFHADLAECADCHTGAAASTTLDMRFMPNHDDCSACHDVEDTDNCVTCHYEDVYEPLIQKKSELFFNHKFHFEDQKIECESCHKGFKQVDYSSELSNPNPLMEDCYSCHNDKTIAANDCESCHKSTADLIPQNHKSSMFITAHKFQATAFDANCVMCHDKNNSCEDCHAGGSMLTGQNTSRDFYQPYSPSTFIDGAKQQKINRVHELNYRFVHGIDAKGKTNDCQSCHQVETFCASCHQSESNDFALGGILPASHLKNNFFTIGPGSGGGDHALLARRDIESCASCHDVQGADPTCITCHLDSDGIIGTNPKTHARNFMRDVRGDWHDSEGSVCYNCHTSSKPFSPAGIGFCGYCHGGN